MAAIDNLPGSVPAEDHIDLIPAPINKKVLINKDGATRDIVNEVLQTYSDSRNQLKQFGQYFKCDTLLQTCYNIWHFWKDRVRYKIDPDGVQWIKSPGALWDGGKDPFGDCKSFSIAVACSLHALNIKGAFRFVSFGANVTAPTHVFVVVKDKGQEIIIDCVWHSFNSTKPWSKKWDYNMTAIYRISGVDTSNGRGVLQLDASNADGITDQELDLLALKQRMEMEQMIAAKVHGIGSLHDNAYEVELIAINNALAELGKRRGNTKFRNLKIIDFGHAGEPRKRVPQVSPQKLSGTAEVGLFGSRKRKKEREQSGQMNKREQRRYDRQVKRNEAGKGISKKWAKVLESKNITVNKKKANFLKFITAPVRLLIKAGTTTALRITLPKNAPFFLYTFLPENIVSRVPDAVQAKRAKALAAKDNIIKKIGMKPTTFENIIRSGIMNRYGMTPEATLAKWMKEANFQVSGIGDILGGGLQALGLDFNNQEAPDISDWTGVPADQMTDLANQVQQQQQYPQPNNDGYFPETSYGGYGGSYGGYGSNSQSSNNDSYSKADDPTGDGPLTKSKELPGVEVTAPAKKDNTILYAGLGLLALAVMSGKPKKH